MWDARLLPSACGCTFCSMSFLLLKLPTRLSSATRTLSSCSPDSRSDTSLPKSWYYNRDIAVVAVALIVLYIYLYLSFFNFQFSVWIHVWLCLSSCQSTYLDATARRFECLQPCHSSCICGAQRPRYMLYKLCTAAHLHTCFVSHV